MTRAIALAMGVAAACGGARDELAPAPAQEPVANTTPNELFARGAPTFVRGTAGDDRADRAIAIQIELIRGIAFPDAAVVDDTAGVWPERAAVYGGPHVNALVARAGLPFALGPGRLAIGGEVFEGDGYQLIAVVPAAGDRPEHILYAGTGTPGIGEINAVSHGAESIVVADGFGVLVTGRWERGDDGALRAVLGPRARRIAWRAVPRGQVTYRFPQQLPPEATEVATIELCDRAVAAAVDRLGLTDPVAIDIYVYPDHGSKRSLTGNGGDGHAVVASRALHVVPGGDTEGLVTHEATHVLAYEAWGAAGTPLLGEGLAVWVTGRYAGTPLAEYRGAFTEPPAIAELLGPAFRKLPEPTSYPLAGIFVDVAVRAVGLDNVRAHLVGASPATWEAACRAAGTTPEALESAFATALTGPSRRRRRRRRGGRGRRRLAGRWGWCSPTW